MLITWKQLLFQILTFVLDKTYQTWVSVTGWVIHPRKFHLSGWQNSLMHGHLQCGWLIIQETRRNSTYSFMVQFPPRINKVLFDCTTIHNCMGVHYTVLYYTLLFSIPEFFVISILHTQTTHKQLHTYPHSVLPHPTSGWWPPQSVSQSERVQTLVVELLADQ